MRGERGVAGTGRERSEEVRPVPAGDPVAAVTGTRPPAGPRPAPHGFHPLAPYRGTLRRFLLVHRHVLGLLAGGVVAYARALPPARRRGLRSGPVRLLALTLRPMLDREIARLPLPAQLRRRLELLGPTYVKLGQIMAIREDLLPASVCRELQNLFDRLPPISFEQARGLIEAGLGRPLEAAFRSVDPLPLGSASIAQVHRAETLAGDAVVIKVMKPGIRETIEADLRLLRGLGRVLQWLLPRYQPRQIIQEFSGYTIREVDFTYEADNAETFATHFHDTPGVVFPRVHRELSSETVLTMDFLDGEKPSAASTAGLLPDERARLLDLGASSIIRMLYQDGFFHADLHPANLLILRGEELRIGFIDLGMVGRFDERMKRRMLYYYHALVTGDVEGAAKFLTDMATIGPAGNPQGFRRAVTDLSRRFVTHTRHGEFSIAQLILRSVALGGRFRVFFPVEMTLMVKALVTFEGVGRMLDPELDVAAVSRRHVAEVFHHHFSPRALTRELLRSSPELIDVLVQLPRLLTAGYRHIEEGLERPPQRPLAGVRSGIIAAACIVGGVVALVSGGSAFLWGALFALAVGLSLWGR